MGYSEQLSVEMLFLYAVNIILVFKFCPFGSWWKSNIISAKKKIKKGHSASEMEVEFSLFLYFKGSK